MGMKGFPTSSDIYLELDGKKVAVVQSYTAKASKSSKSVEAFGESELSDILTAAFNEAVKRVDADAEEVMGQITGGGIEAGAAMIVGGSFPKRK